MVLSAISKKVPHRKVIFLSHPTQFEELSFRYTSSSGNAKANIIILSSSYCRQRDYKVGSYDQDLFHHLKHRVTSFCYTSSKLDVFGDSKLDVLAQVVTSIPTYIFPHTYPSRITWQYITAW